MTPGTSARLMEYFTEDRRFELATRIRAAGDFRLPPLPHFNSAPCDQHSDLEQSCMRCGVLFRKHQRVGIAWLYAVRKGLIADSVGPQPLDAQVLAPSGWVDMGSLRAGDPVIDPDGSASTVLEVTPRGVQDVYRLEFSDGTWAESTMDHLWKVRTEKAPYLTRVGRESRDGLNWRVLPLREAMQWRHGKAVPLIESPPDFAEQPLPLDPYLLGLLLGDGSLVRLPSFTNHSKDKELLTALERALPSGVTAKLIKGNTRCPSYGLSTVRGNSSNPLTLALRELGLMGHRSHEKFVPSVYKWASAKTRLAVLQGLMDTDGNWASGSVEFSSSSKQLAEDVADLARSLGLRTSGPKVRQTSYVYLGEKRTGRPAYRVFIAERADCRVFRLERKLREQPRQRVRGLEGVNVGARKDWQRDQPVKWIRSVTYSRTVPVQCIRVSALSGLYVTDNWTVTHNTGKTIVAAGLLGLLHETGELGSSRGLIVTRSGTPLMQWQRQMQRLLPDLGITATVGTRAQRVEGYLRPWTVGLMGYHMLQRDIEDMLEFPIRTLIVDDVDALRHPHTKTSYCLKRLAQDCHRVVVLSGTPLQKRLHELHSVLEPVGGRQIFGSAHAFEQRYVRQEKVTIVTGTGPKRQTRHIRKVVGYQNIEEFAQLVKPLALRRTAADIDDVDLPAVSPHDVFLDLYPAQVEKYRELRQGVLKIIKASGRQVKRAAAAAQFTYGAMLCSGLATLGEEDRPQTSVKMDWLEEKIVDGDLSDEKVVVFMNYKNDQPLSAEVWTPQGLKTMGEIKVGDSVFSLEGVPSTVTAVYPAGIRDVYKVNFSDGTWAESSATHLWRVSVGENEEEVLPLHVIMTELMQPAHRKRVVRVPFIEPQDFEESPLPFDPYALGLLLGDGCFQGVPNFCSEDEELLQAVELAAIEIGCKATRFVREGFKLPFTSVNLPKASYGKGSGRENPLTSILKSFGLWKHVAHEKFIPELYKTASIKTRLAILQGLMDTDGTVSSSGRAVFVTVSPRLVDDVAWIARSLGMLVTTKKYNHCPSESRTRPFYHVNVTSSLPVFRLSRKLSKQRCEVGDKRVVDVVWQRREQTQCLEVSAPSHCYVTNGFTPTHNTIRAMRARLDRAGVSSAIIWGEEPNPAVRFAEQERFWHDPQCRVLIGTTAIEQSLNLQIARHLVNVDTIMNAARMVQLSGRIRRDGSQFKTVYVHNLLTNGTQEEAYLPLLEREQALQDAVWDEKSELFQELSPLALLTLIGKSTV